MAEESPNPTWYEQAAGACDAAAIEALVAGGQTVYPLQLGELLDEAGSPG